MALIGYARVSTQDQSLNSQLDALKAAGCKKIYQEKVSGARDDRPELEKCLDYIRDGDTLVVLKLDRLGRSLHHLVTVINLLHDKEANFRSLSDSIDTTTASGRLTFHVMGAMAEFEKSLNADRTRLGLASARARGRMGGRPKALDMQKAQVIDQRRSERVPVAAIAKELGIGPATIYRYLKSQEARVA
ncbi:recombinase family protein [Arthrobacter sp. BB-1]|uniref:recombinase family protein n=1 Tax=unclassified Arthrobacter TaxID=235627 RepID=UPI0010EBB029|nr:MULTISPECIES: recombinase family protein [unclassified Arthrobacter]TNB71605.1 recombinase family protein [Arthrobacter sp. BB-1]VII96913.1 Site-specific recombinase, resolvase family [Arthrobacter sp. DR-2P]